MTTASIMGQLILPNSWVVFKLPSDETKILQLKPDITVSLGKYGSFPSNLLIHRPYYLTFEVQDKRPDETYSRLRVVPAAELHADVLEGGDPSTNPDDGLDRDDIVAAAAAAVAIGAVASDDPSTMRSNRHTIDEPSRQTLTADEIETLKLQGTSAGKDLIAKLMLSHTGIDEKTEYSLAKYKILKTKKYIRRFTVLPLDSTLLAQCMLEKDGNKVLDLRQEMLALLCCWGDVHYAAEEAPQEQAPAAESIEGENSSEAYKPPEIVGGRWLVVDDTGGALVGAMAERMGILYPSPKTSTTAASAQTADATTMADPTPMPIALESDTTAKAEPDTDTAINMKPDANGPPAGIINLNEANPTDSQATAHADPPNQPPHKTRRNRKNDYEVPYSGTNTITLLHSNTQPNLSGLRHFGLDIQEPDPDFDASPLHTNILALNWLQLLAPEQDPIYGPEPEPVDAETIQGWKSSRRGIYHRKRRRWARTRFIVDSARAGGFSGLLVASTMDFTSILKHTLPLLAPGAPIAIYSPNIEPLIQLADSFSIQRRTSWSSEPPDEAIGKTIEELERWPGTPEFPLNPTLLLGVTIQTSRVRRWQTLPGRMHPLMMDRGGAEGYLFTAWKVRRAEGKVLARGRIKRRKTAATTQ